MTKKRKFVTPIDGDWVLLGKPSVTLPSDWFIAKVLWFDASDVVTEHRPPSGGEPYRQVFGRSYVVASGAYLNLAHRQDEARKAVAELQAAVRDAEAALSRAREAVWERLDQEWPE